MDPNKSTIFSYSQSRQTNTERRNWRRITDIWLKLFWFSKGSTIAKKYYDTQILCRMRARIAFRKKHAITKQHPIAWRHCLTRRPTGELDNPLEKTCHFGRKRPPYPTGMSVSPNIHRGICTKVILRDVMLVECFSIMFYHRELLIFRSFRHVTVIITRLD